MEQERQLILIITTMVIVLVTVFLIALFAIFQRRKNKLLEEQEEAQKRFEKEITETQIEIREETLRNISWELHDNIGQLLTLAKIQIEQTCCPEELDNVSETVTKSLTELRALSKLINPEFINSVRLQEALRLEIERFNRLQYINASLSIQGEQREVDQKHGIIIFRILQEFFSNTIKHSKAANLNVVLNYRKDELEIWAKDDGIGFDASKETHKGIGLENIKNRAKVINVKAELQSELEKGTSLKINYYF